MQAQIHQLEHDAYRGVLRAFQAKCDAITWEMEGLLTDLRKELRISNDEHSELMKMVLADDVNRSIREWRQKSQRVHDALPRLSFSSHKRQKTSQTHGHQLPTLSVEKSMQHPPSGLHGDRQLSKRMFSTTEPAEAARCERLVGRKVWTRWPGDETFFEAVITEFDPHQGRHHLVYDINTKEETSEWVNLKEVPPEDIKWNDDSVSDAGKRRRSSSSRSRKRHVPLKDDMGVKIADDIKLLNTESERVYEDIELLNTEALIKEVERVCNKAHPDPLELKNTKKLLKEHEQTLINAIGRLGDPSDGKSDGDSPLSPGPPNGVPLLSPGSPDGVLALSRGPAHGLSPGSWDGVLPLTPGYSPYSPGAPDGDPPFSLWTVDKG